MIWATRPASARSRISSTPRSAPSISTAGARRLRRGPHHQPFGEAIVSDVRNNSRVMIDDFALAARIWERASAHVPIFLGGRQAIAMNERFRYYRYRPGQRFDWHADAPFRRANGEASRLSFIIYLNDDFTGGETTVMDKTITPKRGMALLFRHELLHEGRAVKSGTQVCHADRRDVRTRSGRRGASQRDCPRNPGGRFRRACG